jgi:hypothetical protein
MEVSLPHFVCDAAFGNFDVMRKIDKLGGVSTFSMSVSSSTWLWDVLGYHIPPNSWRGALNEEKFICSCHAIYGPNDRIIYQQLLTNAFTATAIDVQNSNEFTSSSSKNSSLLSSIRYNANL